MCRKDLYDLSSLRRGGHPEACLCQPQQNLPDHPVGQSQSPRPGTPHKRQGKPCHWPGKMCIAVAVRTLDTMQF